MIYATPPAQFAIRQVFSGRKLNKNDITSEYAQRMQQFTVERLDHYNERKSMWLEILVEDRKAGPAETAAARIDFGDWLESLECKRRKIAETLSNGEATIAIAAKFRLSPGRISQLRRELPDDWERFHEDPEKCAPVERSSTSTPVTLNGHALRNRIAPIPALKTERSNGLHVV